MTTTTLAMASWSEITEDVRDYWWIYLSMPLIAAFVGWSTKIVVVEMPLKSLGR